MADAETVRRLALDLPGVHDDSESERLAFSVGGKGFCWSYMERVDPKKPRVLRPDAVAIRTALERKELLIQADRATFFDDDHYRGYPSVLVRLPAIAEDELEALLKGAWDIQVRKLPVKLRRFLQGGD